MDKITKAQFEKFKPKTRGYMVYMCGNRADQPNVPNESCPYVAGTKQHRDWHLGQYEALLEVIDNEE